MSKLPVLSSKKVARILRSLGFELIRQKGSHAYYQHPDGRATVVPMHGGEDVRKGTLRAILRDIEMEPKEFERLRKRA